MSAAELVKAVEGAGFRIAVTEAGPQLTRRRPGAELPPDLLAALKAERCAVVDYLCECEQCGRVVLPEDRERMCDPAFCDLGGAKEVRNKFGAVIQLATPRCPHKKPVK